MKVGDLVRVKPSLAVIGSLLPAAPGIIMTMFEDSSGFFDCLVLFACGAEWLSDIQLEVLNESR